MRTLKATLLIALTLFASLPICCCIGKALAESGSIENVHSCCSESLPIDGGSNGPDCQCLDRGTMADPAPEMTWAASQVGIDITPTPFLVELDDLDSDLGAHLEFVQSNAPPPPLLAMSAHQHCIVFAMFQV